MFTLPNLRVDQERNSFRKTYSARYVESYVHVATVLEFASDVVINPQTGATLYGGQEFALKAAGDNSLLPWSYMSASPRIERNHCPYGRHDEHSR